MSPPVTLLQYLAMVLRGLPAALGVGLIARLLIAAPLAGLALVTHTFLLVVMNEGFGETGSMWTHVLALRGTRLVAGTALWGLVAYLATTLLTRALMGGVGKLFSDLASVPGWIATTARDAGTTGIAVLAGAFALGEIGGTLVGNRVLLITLFLGGYFALSTGKSGTLLTVSRLAWWDIERLLASGPPNHRFKPERIVVLQVGLAFGLLRAATLPYQPGIGLCGGVSLGLVALVLLGLSVRRAPVLAALAAAALVDAVLGTAIADDGGWAEAGGTWSGWVNSPGAFTAVLHGIPPSAATFAGIVLGGQPNLFPPVQLPDAWGPSDPKPYWGNGTVKRPFTDQNPHDGTPPTGWLGDRPQIPHEGIPSPAQPGDEIGFEPDDSADAPTEPGVDGGDGETGKAPGESSTRPPGETGPPEPSTEDPTAPGTPPEGEAPPTEGEAPAEPTEGDAPEEPTEGEAPEEPTEGEAPQKPAEGEPPEKPAEGKAPEKPAEGEPPKEPEKPETPPKPDEDPEDAEDAEDEDEEDEDEDEEDEDEDEEEEEEEEEDAPPEPPKDLTPAELAAFQKKFQDLIDAKKKDGYYVRNPGLIKKAWNNTVGRPWDWFVGNKGGQCGEFGEWGEQWSRQMVKDLFGPEAAVDTIYVQEASTADPKDWTDDIDGIVTGNHRATRVVLPNGQRMVLDYWESMGRGGGKAKILTEKEWVDKWHKEFGSDFKAEIADPEDAPDMASVKKTMEGTADKSDAYRLDILKKTYGPKGEAYFNSWKRDPW